MVSIIILTRNNLAYSKRCVESLYQHTDRDAFELILIDNGSSDGTPRWTEGIARTHVNVRFELNADNRGFARGSNQGARLARGEYLLFLNNDTLVAPGWLEPLVQTADRDPSIAIVGNLQLYPGTDLVQHAGVAVGSDRMPVPMYEGHSAASAMVRKSRDYDFVSGSCMLVRADVFRSVGGFDEAYRNSLEDSDLCLKARKAGYRIRYCPESRIYHYGSQTAGRFDNDARNRERFRSRWSRSLSPTEEAYWLEDGYPACLEAESAIDRHVWRVRKQSRDMVNSWSWSITRPLRWAKRRLKALTNGL